MCGSSRHAKQSHASILYKIVKIINTSKKSIKYRAIRRGVEILVPKKVKRKATAAHCASVYLGAPEYRRQRVLQKGKRIALSSDGIEMSMGDDPRWCRPAAHVASEKYCIALAIRHE